MQGLVLGLLALLGQATGQNMPKQMTIAAVFDQGGDMKHELAFKHAVQGINRNRSGEQWGPRQSNVAVHVSATYRIYLYKKLLHSNRRECILSGAVNPKIRWPGIP